MSSRERVASSKESERGYWRVIAFRKADVLASSCFDLAEKVAVRDRWLASQLKRAALSAPLNIAEGHGRGTVKDFLSYLENARASLNEVEYLLDFLVRKKVIAAEDCDRVEAERSEASAVLGGLIKALRLRLQSTNEWQRNLSDEHVAYLADGVAYADD